MKQIKTYINEKLRLTTKQKYTCHPKDKYELRHIIIDRIKDEGSDCDLNDIDTSKITDMSDLFSATINERFKDFNGDISQWNVSNVEDMRYMFYNCEKFNGDISRWDVSHVKYTSNMFHECENFNQDLSGWNVSNIEKMACMFWRCKSFNQNLDSWDVSNDARKRFMFFACPTNPTWYDKKIDEKR